VPPHMTKAKGTGTTSLALRALCHQNENTENATAKPATTIAASAIERWRTVYGFGASRMTSPQSCYGAHPLPAYGGTSRADAS